MPTITGVADGGNVVNAQCTAPAAGAFLASASTAAPLQSIENDLATLDAKKLDRGGGVMNGTLTMEANILMDSGDIDVQAGNDIILEDETALVKLGAAGFSRTRPFHGVWVFDATDDTDWTKSLTGTSIVNAVDTSANNSSDTPKAYFMSGAGLPAACTITGVKVYVKGNNGSRAHTPTGLPYFTLYIEDVTTAAATALGPYTDATTSFSAVAGDISAYVAPHAIDSGAISHAYDPTKERLTIRVACEYGTGIDVGLEFIGATITYTQTAL